VETQQNQDTNIGTTSRLAECEARAKRALAGNERRTTRGATLVSIIVVDVEHALDCNAIAVGRVVTHHSAGIHSEVADTDVVAQMIRIFGLSAAEDAGAITNVTINRMRPDSTDLEAFMMDIVMANHLI
jgi:hypothetical protein